MREQTPGNRRAVLLNYAAAVLAVVAAAVLRQMLVPFFGTAYPFLIFVPSIMLAGWLGGAGPGTVSVLLSLVVIRFFFMAPAQSFVLKSRADLLGLTIFAVVGFLVTYLNQRRRTAIREAEAATQSLRENQVMLEKAYEHQKRIAETLQRSLLMTPAEMQFEGLQVEPFYEAAYDEALVGGDFFDAFALSGNKVALVVGDVSGKGLPAAAHTAEIKYALRAILREYPHPATALIRLNNVVCESQELDSRNFGRFITLALAVIDPRTGAGELSLAGAEPPLLVRRPRSGGVQAEALVTADAADNWEYDSIEGGGLPLCVESKFDYEVRRIEMAVNDTLLMLTDGITEARRKRELLGYDGMANLALEGARRATLREMGETILNGAHQFAGAKLQDDACLLLARRV